MVRDVRPDSTFSNSKVTGFYFRPYRNEYDEAVLEYSRCCCGAVRKQTNRSGYYTLMQHVLRQFPGHESVMLQATTAETGSVLNFVSHSSRNLYGWLDAMDHRVQPPILVLRASRGKTVGGISCYNYQIWLILILITLLFTHILKFGPHIGGDRGRDSFVRRAALQEAPPRAEESAVREHHYYSAYIERCGALFQHGQGDTWAAAARYTAINAGNDSVFEENCNYWDASTIYGFS
ncbi:hypothetical protein L917_07365 [Phytophthora nicotianae]|uniref:Uncharacterized protein n=1 Tax=Phytophthora nicotianae TaxID=4792 RepID=W2LBB9_PHYNI|nr:hypothetical protein L917_07365 [Phytophthora nicotianae]